MYPESGTKAVTKWPKIVLNKAVEERPRRVGPADLDRFHEVLASYGDYDTVFVHVGLSDVATAFGGDPYEVVLDALEATFESVLAPGFTDYFKTSRVYDKQHSRPKHGTFARLFLNDAEYRTDDACKSILVSGEYRFEECDQRDSYSTDGCFEQLRADDVLNVCIGTPVLICSYLHHLEAKYGAPYMSRQTFEGVMHDSGTTAEIEQHTHYPEGTWPLNRLKLTRHLTSTGILETHDFNGLRLYTLPIRELDDHVAGRMDEDPYYITT